MHGSADRLLARPKMLEGCQILVLEDDYLLAQDAARVLEGEGALVLGPYSSESVALRDLSVEQRVSCAVLDIHLDGRICFNVARQLSRRGLPFLFFTALNPTIVPPEFIGARLLQKPLDIGLIVLAIRDLIRNRHLH